MSDPKTRFEAEQDGWVEVSFAAEAEPDEICALCGEDYGECPCPGPTMDEYEYVEIYGVMFAREIEE